MAGAYADIARVLQGARRRQVRVVLLTAAAGGGAAALLCLLAGAIALSAGARTGFRLVALGGAGLALLGSAIGAVWTLLRGARDDEAAARTVAAGEPALRSALLSSVELARARPLLAASGELSVELLDAHLDLTAERARGLDLARAIPDRAARQAGWALAAVLGLHLLGLAGLGHGFRAAYGRVLGGDPPGAPAVQADPITGDIELTYRYPAYMKRDPRTLSGTGGEVRAPRGTEVELKTRADRPVVAAEIVIEQEGLVPAAQPASPAAAQGTGSGDEATARPSTGSGRAAPDSLTPSVGRAPARPESRGHPEPVEGGAGAPVLKRRALAVAGGRDLSGRFVVDQGGSYRFRYLDAKGRVVAEGPPIPIAVEVDLPPQARITAPERELEVDANAVVAIEWQAEDDVGLAEVALVVKAPAGEPQRRVLRKGDGLRRDGGTQQLALAPERLAEGEAIEYWIEAVDGDTVSGPKTAASEHQFVKVYSEAEHRRAVLERARQAFEELVALLGDRLETLAEGPVATADRLPVAQQLDARTRRLSETLREAARELRRDPAGAREVAAALQNVAGNVRVAEQRVAALRAAIAQAFRVRVRPDASLVRNMTSADAALDATMEKGVLYLEQLLDKQRAQDLVRLAKDLAQRRRDLAGLLEKYRASPTEAAKKEVLAQISRMKDRVKDLLARMAELSKGFNDEHMNEEALAELAKSQDLMGGLDEVEKKLAAGDVEGAMKALDQMAGAMDQMLAGLERTAGRPDEKAQQLMKEMLAFKDQLEQVQSEQRRTAEETDQVRRRYRQKIADRMKGAEGDLKKLAELAGKARQDLERAEPGVTMRAEPEYELSREAVKDLERALGMRELEGAAEAVTRAQPSVERLAMELDEDAALGDRGAPLTGREPEQVAEARKHAMDAVPKVREIREKLQRMFPDPRQVLGQEEQRKLGELAQKQDQLERKAGRLQSQLYDLSQKAPVFPPSAQEELSESRGHMGEAAAELGARNPQRGHGQQELAMDALSRLQKGLEEAAKKGGGSGGGQGFPFPFAESGGEQEGDGREASREKVKIPGAEAHRVPEEFRKDLLDAMKQGAPERYRGEVQRYYEELVK
ncbi:DUF4175 family protein [Anaeromyxobacter dehalogenans]|uniref:DUF4175 domain-containing protein n=1 Tax=Anaeromyxobacter dehalogenans (strain 2CP-C) TaxID=290397 RepID=Q2IHH3_ANADE|nr:DUF4175 family protein [Anaeromyxobacter dehalogenans]ABC84034.1 hypothetical protein Adeh_4270 [Anaeromyxobacter dehalogenans 2CP-C]